MAELIGKLDNWKNREFGRIEFARFVFDLAKDCLDLYYDKWILSSAWFLRLDDKIITDTIIKCNSRNNDYANVGASCRYSIRVPGKFPVYMWTNQEENGYFVAAKFLGTWCECLFLCRNSVPTDSDVKILPIMAGMLVSQSESKNYA